jgi:acyl-CoA reductase-like NAD-dependent aldehyde dehydrogenase
VDVDDVIRMANDSAYGLAAYVWSQDINAALTTAHRLEAGWVQVNQGRDVRPGRVRVPASAACPASGTCRP